MTRRATLPGADELFRRTDEELPPAREALPEPPPVSRESPIPTPPASAAGGPVFEQNGSRPRHDEKVTFYCTASELTRLEKARLTLRSDHKLHSDRGRIVRAALAEILDDFEEQGSSSALLRRLSSG